MRQRPLRGAECALLRPEAEASFEHSTVIGTCIGWYSFFFPFLSLSSINQVLYFSFSVVLPSIMLSPRKFCLIIVSSNLC